MAKSKRQMTQAKRAREQALRDRRLRKQEKKQANAALRAQGIDPHAQVYTDVDENTETEAEAGPA
jgi:hypothetical protein